MKVTTRQLRANLSKYLKLALTKDIIILNRGKEVGKLIGYSGDARDLPKDKVYLKTKDAVYTTPKVKKIYDNISNGKYDCGCKKIDGQVLCKKHWRS